jgi:hypothetical protein
MRSTFLLLWPVVACLHSAPSPQASASVQLGSAFVTHPGSGGSIDLEGVQRRVEGSLEALQLCYDRRLREQPGLGGEVLIHTGISTQGEHTHACISEDTTGDSGIVACVNAFVAETRYPAAQGQPVDVSLPFSFVPG